MKDRITEAKGFRAMDKTSFIRAKLSSKTGASLVMALVFLLLTISVGAVIVSSSSTAVGLATSLKDDEQGFLTVYSAAEIVRSNVDGVTLTETFISESHSACGIASSSLGPSYSITSSLISGEILELYKPSAPASKSFLVEADALGLEDVSVTMTMDSEHNLRLVFQEQGEAQYMVTLFIPAENDSTVNTETISHDESGVLCDRDIITEIDTVEWGLGTISKGGSI